MTEPNDPQAAPTRRPDELPRYETLTPHAPFTPGVGIRMGAMPLGRPGPPGPPVPATWSADPTERHELRWWSGVAWTDWVADDGEVAEDPLQP